MRYLKASGNLSIAASSSRGFGLFLQAICGIHLSYPETTQPGFTHTHTGSPRDACASLCSVRFVVCVFWVCRDSDALPERGVERNVVLDGLSSKDVATKISELLG